MKKILFLVLGFLAFPALVRGQAVPKPATQAQVDAGVNRLSFVTPLTLQNKAGGSGGGTNQPVNLNTRSGSPYFFAPETAAADYSGQLGFVETTGSPTGGMSVFLSSSTTTGDWKGLSFLPGSLIIGSEGHMPMPLNQSAAMLLYANGSPYLSSLNDTSSVVVSDANLRLANMNMWHQSGIAFDYVDWINSGNHALGTVSRGFNGGYIATGNSYFQEACADKFYLGVNGVNNSFSIQSSLGTGGQQLQVMTMDFGSGYLSRTKPWTYWSKGVAAGLSHTNAAYVAAMTLDHDGGNLTVLSNLTVTSGTFRGNSSGLTNANATTLLGSGTVPTARLGSGSATGSTFLRGDQTFASLSSLALNLNTRSGSPYFFAPETAAADYSGQLGFVETTGSPTGGMSVFLSTSTTTGDWKGLSFLPGSLIIGSEGHMPMPLNQTAGMLLYANGSPYLSSLNDTSSVVVSDANLRMANMNMWHQSGIAFDYVDWINSGNHALGTASRGFNGGYICTGNSYYQEACSDKFYIGVNGVQNSFSIQSTLGTGGLQLQVSTIDFGSGYLSRSSPWSYWSKCVPAGVSHTNAAYLAAMTLDHTNSILTVRSNIVTTFGSFIGNGSGLTNLPVEFCIAASDETTAIATGTGKVTFRAPYAFTLTQVRASVNTAPTGSTILIDVNESGTTVLSTKLMIDATEKTSTTAATPYVISDAAIADDAEITIDFDQVGSSVTGTGVKVWLKGTR